MSSPKGRILVTDDDAAIRTVVREALRRAGHTVETAGSVAEQRRALASFRPQVLVTDVVLPDGDGLDIIGEIRVTQPDLPVIVLSAQNTFTTALRANERGAFEYLPKPFDLGALTDTVAEALTAAAASQTSPEGKAQEDLPLIGRSPPMQEVYRTVARVVSNDLTVLVLGESGTGKELVARAIHDFGPRAKAPFVAVNMAAIPRDLIESELFGYERGAFTGAAQRNSGRFEQAQGGTLFLDEIGDMPLEAQTRLLRVLQSGEFTPVGSARAIRADVRIIAATHQDLPKLIAENGFREDLYYRLNVVPVRLPALRERGEDVAELARHFLDRAVADGLPRKVLDTSAAERLASHSWPGNVRELENLMRRLAALGRDSVISSAQVEQALAQAPAATPGPMPIASEVKLEEAIEHQLARHFAGFAPSLPPDGLYDRILAEIERPLFRLTLAAVRGNQLKAAKLLGMNRNTLRKKLTDLGVGPQVRRGD
jgi:two-component system, NtrC family, nitrogen regulation response regulator GlnG